MPFNLTFGMNAVLPKEFLTPTLQVAQQSNWIGHELPNKIDNLKKLEDTRVTKVGHMYA